MFRRGWEPNSTGELVFRTIGFGLWRYIVYAKAKGSGVAFVQPSGTPGARITSDRAFADREAAYAWALTQLETVHVQFMAYLDAQAGSGE